jgi:hypothetical protein
MSSYYLVSPYDVNELKKVYELYQNGKPITTIADIVLGCHGGHQNNKIKDMLQYIEDNKGIV